MRETKHIINSNGHKISAILNSDESYDTPIVITCHGLSRNKDGEKYKTLQKYLEQKDFACCRIDFQGHGESEGNQSKFSVYDGVDNVHSAVNYLSELGYNIFGLFGSSTGAEVACVYAAEYPQNIYAMILRAPTLGEAYDFAPAVTCPTMILHGSDDYIPVELQRNFLQRFVRNAELKIIDGANHACEVREHQNIMARYATDWFERWLNNIESMQTFEIDSKKDVKNASKQSFLKKIFHY